MTNQPLIECVPNFSEGRDLNIIRQIATAIEAVEGAKLLGVDPGKATNRTVITFVGTPEAVVEAAFLAIQKAADLIDMRKQRGEHPRMGATDVCPLIPIANISMEETAAWAHQLAKRVGEELGIPIYMYENAATQPERQNLATIRAGQYEGLPQKLQALEWKPDYGPSTFNPKAGATAIGARDYLIAYNVNLNTTSVRRANSVAFDVREQGRLKRKGSPERIPGKLRAAKAIGWYIEEYGIAQVSMNLTNISITSIHEAFEACRESATRRGLRVTGSELVGLIPLDAMLDAGKYYLRQQQRSVGVSEEELIKIAVKSMGLDELTPFDPDKKIIEYKMRDPNDTPIIYSTLKDFANETASESVMPGGGCTAAYAGALGAALGTMAANLSAHKRGWEDRWEFFSNWAEKGQCLKDELLQLVDEDAKAFNTIIAAHRLPRATEEEKKARQQAIEEATKLAIETPFKTLELAWQALELLKIMAQEGNPNSTSDAGVGALCARTAMRAALLNIQTNIVGLTDQAYAKSKLDHAEALAAKATAMEGEILQIVRSKM